MKTKLLRTAVLLAGLIGSTAALAAPTYVYVGSWDVYGGPDWSNLDAPIYTGQQAAALIFGGTAGEYAISTVDSSVANINNMAWLDQIYIGLASFGESYFVDSNQNGLYDISGDTSAYVQDNAFGGQYINYAFRLQDNGTQVPEPISLALVGLGLFGIGAVRRRRAV